MSALQQLESMLAYWRVDPVCFVVEAIGATPNRKQARILTALAGWDPDEYEQGRFTALPPEKAGRVSVKSAHGVGKTTTDAWAILWFITCHFPCKIAATAPTKHQLEDALWAELGSWHRKMLPALRDRLEMTTDRIVLKAAPKEAFATAKTARKEQPEALQGLHSQNMLMILDEASGIDEAVFLAGEGSLSTAGAKILMTSNPTRTSGYFFDSQTRTKRSWHCETITCFDVQGTSLFNQVYIDSVRIRHGENSNYYRIRVLGEFPTGDDDAVVPLHLVTDALDRDIRVTKDDPVVWGVDVARFGDDRTCLAKRRKNVMLEKVKSWQNMDNMQVAGIITREYWDTPEADRPDDILVDVIGVGSGVVDRLRENGLPVIGVNVSESASQSDRYFRLRDELWFLARQFFEDRACSIPDGDEDFVQELTTPKYTVLGSGKLQVESKQAVKDRTLEKRSPDKADAFILTFASQKVRKNVWKDIVYPNNGVI